MTAAATNPEVSLAAFLLPTNELPPADNVPDDFGTGAATVTLNTVSGQVCYVIETEAPETLAAAHIHEGDATETGGIFIDFDIEPGENEYSGCVQSTPGQAQAVAADPAGYYVNVHTPTYTAGAMRGQLEELGPSAGDLIMLPEPIRAYDSRDPGKTPVSVDTTRTIDLTMAGEGAQARPVLPIGARAALITLTVTNTGTSTGGGGGFVTVFSNALIGGNPATSTINWTAANQDIATTTTVAVDGSGKIKVLAGGSATDVIVDVIGYYSPSVPLPLPPTPTTTSTTTP